MREISLEERFAVLTSREGWFGRASQEFQKELLARSRPEGGPDSRITDKSTVTS